MQKNLYYKDFSKLDLDVGYKIMELEIYGLDFKHPIRFLFMEAWDSFKRNNWSYDGATFVSERNSLSLFELAAFIHDWRNSMGYVGKWVDDEFIDIMICLNYSFKIIQTRWLLMRLTFLNVLLHKYNKTYNNYKPKIIFKL